MRGEFADLAIVVVYYVVATGEPSMHRDGKDRDDCHQSDRNRNGRRVPAPRDSLV
jgi:hypothetical protein